MEPDGAARPTQGKHRSHEAADDKRHAQMDGREGDGTNLREEHFRTQAAEGRASEKGSRRGHARHEMAAPGQALTIASVPAEEQAMRPYGAAQGGDSLFQGNKTALDERKSLPLLVTDGPRTFPMGKVPKKEMYESERVAAATGAAASPGQPVPAGAAVRPENCDHGCIVALDDPTAVGGGGSDENVKISVKFTPANGGESTVKTVTERSPTKTRGDVEEAFNKTAVFMTEEGSKTPAEKFTWDKFRKEQMQDEELEVLLTYCETGIPPSNVLLRTHLETKEQYVAKQMTPGSEGSGILYRIHSTKDGERLQLMVPRKYQAQLVEHVHAKMGHPASEAMCLALKQRFYWRTMEADCRTCMKYCDACQRWRDKKLPLGRASGHS